MGRFPSKMPRSCLNRIRPLVRVPSTPSIDNSNNEKRRDGLSDGAKDDSGGGYKKSVAVVSGRKIMIVVDSKVEAKTAVQWALSYVVQTQDMIILLHVARPSKQGDQSIKSLISIPRIAEFLTCMQSICQLKRPEIGPCGGCGGGRERQRLCYSGGSKEARGGPASTGAEETVGGVAAGDDVARRQVAAANGVAEYCIENAGCMAIAVRRKSRKNGGYLITTKRQKEFWLLA